MLADVLRVRIVGRVAIASTSHRFPERATDSGNGIKVHKPGGARCLDISSGWPGKNRGHWNEDKNSQWLVPMRHTKKEGWAVLAF